MIAIVTIENSNGISFNGRRCSRDAAVYQRIEQMGYSDVPPSLPTEVLNSISKLKWRDGIYLFEKADPGDLIQYFDKVVIYKWNRDYPSDVKFTSDMSDFIVSGVSEFVGNSHEAITEEIYVRKENK